MQKNFQVILITTGAMCTTLAFAQKCHEEKNNHLVHTAQSVYLSQHPGFVEMPSFIIATPDYFAAKWRNRIIRIWFIPYTENTYCAVCDKDLLFAILWGSSITPPKHVFKAILVQT